jgi:hypothetical protein
MTDSKCGYGKQQVQLYRGCQAETLEHVWNPGGFCPCRIGGGGRPGWQQPGCAQSKIVAGRQQLVVAGILQCRCTAAGHLD